MKGRPHSNPKGLKEAKQTISKMTQEYSQLSKDKQRLENEIEKLQHDKNDLEVRLLRSTAQLTNALKITKEQSATLTAIQNKPTEEKSTTTSEVASQNPAVTTPVEPEGYVSGAVKGLLYYSTVGLVNLFNQSSATATPPAPKIDTAPTVTAKI